MLLIGRDVQSELRPVALNQGHGWHAILGCLLCALATAIGQGVAGVFGRRNGGHGGVGVHRSRFVNHAVVLIPGNIACLQVGHGLLKLRRAFEPVGACAFYATGRCILLFGPAWRLDFAGNNTQTNIALSCVTDWIFQGVHVLDLARSNVKLGTFRHQGLIAVLVELLLGGYPDRFTDGHRANCFGRAVTCAHNRHPFSNVWPE